VVFVVGYPLLPWVAVMALGFTFGPIFQMDPGRRRRVLAIAGSALVIGFILLRALNIYGDPAPWSKQSTLLVTALSFLRTTKYPPSLQFLMMTLGPMLLALRWFERMPSRLSIPLTNIGRVPFFFYVVHFWTLHFIASLLAAIRYGGSSLAYFFYPLPSMGGPRELFPPNFGYSLPVVYIVWIALVAGLYPLCRQFADFKRRRVGWWVSYL
jgi:uncharacterized membrane protein